MIPGHLEALIRVPTGGAPLLANNAAQALGSLTLPAADYFLTSSGGLPGLCATMQQLLNDNLQGYPLTAAALAAAAGWGTWNTAWLFNEVAGNAAPAYGGVTLTSSGIVYGNAGPRGGIDKAFAFDTNTDTLNGGNNFNAGANDLGFVVVAKFGAAGTFDILGKGYPAGGPLMVTETPGNKGRMIVSDGVNSASAQATTDIPTDVWVVLLGVIERGAGLRFGWIRLDTLASSFSSIASVASVGALTNASNFLFGNQFYGAHTSMQLAFGAVGFGAGAMSGMVSNFSTALTNIANAVNASWVVSPSTTDGRVSIGWTGYTTPTWSFTWTNTTLRDLLGFTGDIALATTTQTGTKQARSIWFPDCQLFIRDSDPRLAPLGNDNRSTVAPTGADPVTIGGTKFRQHKGLLWSHIPLERIREQSATYANASWRQFWDDTQVGNGLSWFPRGSNVLIIDHTGQAVGSDMNVSGKGPTNGWHIVDAGRIDPKRADAEGWWGFWSLELPQLIAEDA